MYDAGVPRVCDPEYRCIEEIVVIGIHFCIGFMIQSTVALQCIALKRDDSCGD